MSAWVIEIQNDAEYVLDAPHLIKAIETVLARHDVEDDSTITVVVTNNDEVQELNRQHRGIDAPTDVLSFPAEPLPEEVEEDPYLGDLVIAYPYAKEQAERENHPLQDSLALLVVHGTLHLLGYDHDTPEHRAEMWAEQAEALKHLGISDAIVPALEQAPHD